MHTSESGPTHAVRPGASILILLFLFLLLQTAPLPCQDAPPEPESDGASAEERFSRLIQEYEKSKRVLDEDYRVTAADLEQLDRLIEQMEEMGSDRLLAGARMLAFLAEKRRSAQQETSSAGGAATASGRDHPAGGGGTGEGGSAGSPGEGRRRTHGGGDGGRAWTIAKWTCLGTGAVCLGLFNAFWYMGDRTYDQYLDATDPSEETRLKNLTGTYDTLSYIFGGVAVAAIGVGLILFALEPADAEAR